MEENGKALIKENETADIEILFELFAFFKYTLGKEHPCL